MFREEEAETTVVDWGWVRDGGGSVQGTRGGSEEKWVNSEYILNTEPTGIADGFDVRGKRERESNTNRYVFAWCVWVAACCGSGGEPGAGQTREGRGGRVSLAMFRLG